MARVNHTAQSFTRQVTISPDVDIEVREVPNWMTVSPMRVEGTGTSVAKTHTFTITVQANTQYVGRLHTLEFHGEFDCLDTLLVMQDAAPPPPDPVYGCTDSLATNYDPNADTDDGSCDYFVEIPGCLDPNATNYNPNANTDNGTCNYPVDEPEPEPVYDTCNSITAERNTIRFNRGVRQQSIRVTINPNISIQVTRLPSWLSASPSRYNGPNTNESHTQVFYINAAVNTGDSRSATIRFSANGCVVDVEVSQASEEVISCNCYTISNDGDSEETFIVRRCSDNTPLTYRIAVGDGRIVCARSEPTTVYGLGTVTDNGQACTRDNDDVCGEYQQPCRTYEVGAFGTDDATIEYTPCIAGGTRTLFIPRGDGGIEVCARNRPTVKYGSGTIYQRGVCGGDTDPGYGTPIPADPYNYYLLNSCGLPFKSVVVRTLNTLTLGRTSGNAYFIDNECFYTNSVSTKAQYDSNFGTLDSRDAPGSTSFGCDACTAANITPPEPELDLDPPRDSVFYNDTLLRYVSGFINQESAAIDACTALPRTTFWDTTAVLDAFSFNLRAIPQAPPIYSRPANGAFARAGWYSNGSISRFWNGSSWAPDTILSCSGTRGDIGAWY
jgi:hypothetical protein